jgi:hypothetical protein
MLSPTAVRSAGITGRKLHVSVYSFSTVLKYYQKCIGQAMRAMGSIDSDQGRSEPDLASNERYVRLTHSTARE